MVRITALLTALLLGLQPTIALAAASAPTPEARIYLTDGTVIQGQLLDEEGDLIIVRVDTQVFTFEPAQVKSIVTIDSLGARAKTETVVEFPYISFLGASAACGLLSWLQFVRAGDKRDDAKLNDSAGLHARANQLEDDADRAELLGWGAALLAAGSLGVALIPRRTERRVFPELTLAPAGATLQMTCRF